MSLRQHWRFDLIIYEKRRQNLFVYGTLRRNVKNRFAQILQASGHTVGPGTVNGRLYQITDYPGLVLLHAPGERVRGDVYRIDAPEEILPVLDAYEGCSSEDPPPHEFERETVQVLLEDGQAIDAFAYVYRGDVNESTRIQSGDFLAQHPI